MSPPALRSAGQEHTKAVSRSILEEAGPSKGKEEDHKATHTGGLSLLQATTSY